MMGKRMPSFLLQLAIGKEKKKDGIPVLEKSGKKTNVLQQ